MEKSKNSERAAQTSRPNKAVEISSKKRLRQKKLPPKAPTFFIGHPNAEDECPDAFVDLVFVLDGSGSIGAKRFGYMKTWMKQVVDNFKIGENFARIGLVHYNKTNKVEIRTEMNHLKQIIFLDILVNIFLRRFTVTPS